jgi:hypothetical protein
MKKIYLAAASVALVLSLGGSAAQADGWCFPMTGRAGINFHWDISMGPNCGGGCQLGPWYQYWPYEAHFVVPAPTGYPYWPAPQVLPSAVPPVPGVGPALVAPPPPPDAKGAVPDVKPINYSYYPYGATYPNIVYGTAPSYWNERK